MGKYLDRKEEAAEKTTPHSRDNLLSHHPIFIFQIENESIVVCEPKSKEVEKKKHRRRTIQKKGKPDHETNKTQ